MTEWLAAGGQGEKTEQELDRWEAHDYLVNTGLSQYITADNFALRFAVKELAKDNSAPTEGSKARLQRLGRFLVGAPRAANEFFWQGRARALRGRSDSDHGGDRKTRKSTMSVVVFLGRHRIYDGAWTEAVVALSSGEAEFYALVKLVVTLIWIKNMLIFRGVEPDEVVAESDSSAARGMASRLGLGRKAKHIDVQMLYICLLYTSDAADE